jgi:hypothetical protein
MHSLINPIEINICMRGTLRCGKATQVKSADESLTADDIRPIFSMM